MIFSTLKTVGTFLKSRQFFGIVLALAAAGFIAIRLVTLFDNYVENQVQQRTEIVMKKHATEQLKEQVRVQIKNQKTVDEVLTEKKPIKAAIHNKHKKIEDKINEDVKNEQDGFVSELLVNVVDGL